MKIDTPKLVGEPSEGGSEVFTVDYFGKKVYLAQSPQAYKQMLIAAGYERVFETAPVFRAENSNTSRHLTEYTSLDLEMEFENDYTEVMFLIRDLLLYILNGLRTRYQKQTERVRKEYKAPPFKVPAKPEDVPILSFAEGVKLLNEAGVSISEDEDINSTQEKLLGTIIQSKYNTDFYILKEYPLDVRAFYTMPSATNPKFSHSYDFMMRGQEVLSGAQRIHDHDLLRERMLHLGLEPDSLGFRDYVQAFGYGCPPHAGGAFGAERVVLNWLGLGT
ncbi:MAG: aspartate--tRNA ligase dps1 [Cirrosporium novae-zelandiae]|nr:MAG: aspartate--tRNA ligase dps1 [Cirrosporium novae-zelandiae]